MSPFSAYRQWWLEEVFYPEWHANVDRAAELYGRKRILRVNFCGKWHFDPKDQRRTLRDKS